MLFALAGSSPHPALAPLPEGFGGRGSRAHAYGACRVPGLTSRGLRFCSLLMGELLGPVPLESLFMKKRKPLDPDDIRWSTRRGGPRKGPGRPAWRKGSVHHSIQRSHVHLIVEATGRSAMGRGMKSVSIRFAHAVNRPAARAQGRWALAHAGSRDSARGAQRLAYVLLNVRKDWRRRHGVTPLVHCEPAALLTRWVWSSMRDEDYPARFVMTARPTYLPDSSSLKTAPSSERAPTRPMWLLTWPSAAMSTSSRMSCTVPTAE